MTHVIIMIMTQLCKKMSGPITGYHLINKECLKVGYGGSLFYCDTCIFLNGVVEHI